MERIQIGDQEVLVGLDWQDMAKDMGEGRAIGQVLKNPIHKGKRFGVVVNGPDERMIGLAPASAKLPSKIPSAAAWLAKSAQIRMHSGGSDSEAVTTDAQSWNWVVIEPISEDLYWMVAIYKGVPLATTDVMGSFESVVLQAQQFQETGEFTVHSPDENIRRTLSFHGSVSPQGFKDLIRRVESGDVKLSELYLRQITGLRMPLFLAALGALVTVILIVLGMHWHQQRLQAEREAANRARGLANAQKAAQAASEYEKKVRQAVYAALEAGKKDVNHTLVSPAPSLIVQQWVKLLGQVNLDQSTWNLRKIHCVAGTLPSCIVEIDRGADGVTRILLQEHPDVQLDGDKGSYQLSGDKLGDRKADWNRLADARSFMVDLISDLQLLRNAGIEYHQDASKEIIKTVTMPTPLVAKFKPGSTDKVGPPPVVQMGIATGQMCLGGARLWQLAGLGEFLDHDGLILKDMDVSVGPEGITSWRMNATYLIRSKPQPVLPIVMVNGRPLQLTLPKGFQEIREATGDVGGSNGVAADLNPAPSASSASGPASGLPPPPPPPPVLPSAPSTSPTAQRF